MRWRRLINWQDDRLWRGTVFRLLVTDYPYETPVDFMLIESLSSLSGFALIVATGYKAGRIVQHLPRAAQSRRKAGGISRAWIVKNWKRRIYPPCPIEQVRIIGNYPPGCR